MLVFSFFPLIVNFISQKTVSIILKAFFDTRLALFTHLITVLIIGFISLLTNLILNYVFIFMYDLGHVGLALATTCAATLSWLISLVFIYKINRGIAHAR